MFTLHNSRFALCLFPSGWCIIEWDGENTLIASTETNLRAWKAILPFNAERKSWLFSKRSPSRQRFLSLRVCVAMFFIKQDFKFPRQVFIKIIEIAIVAVFKTQKSTLKQRRQENLRPCTLCTRCKNFRHFFEGAGKCQCV